jgi:hypothetical protein
MCLTTFCHSWKIPFKQERWESLPIWFSNLFYNSFTNFNWNWESNKTRKKRKVERLSFVFYQPLQKRISLCSKKIGNVTMARFSLLQSVKVPTLLYFLLLYWLGIWKDDKWGQLIFQFFMKGDKKKYLLPLKSITSTKLFLYDYIKTFTWIAKNSFCRKYCSNMF